MSRFSKVVWKEGLFLKPHHLQQSDRYLEKLVASRTAPMAPFSWGMVELAVDDSQLSQGRIELQKAVGVFADGTPFDAPFVSPLPLEISVPEDSIGKRVSIGRLPHQLPPVFRSTFRKTKFARKGDPGTFDGR